MIARAINRKLLFIGILRRNALKLRLMGFNLVSQYGDSPAMRG